VLLFAFRVRETEVDELDLLVLDEGEYLCGLHKLPPIANRFIEYGPPRRGSR
jgi:hypothetical protein